MYDAGHSITVAGIDGVTLQTVSGVGGMLMAGLLLIFLGLVAVAVWKGHASSLAQDLLGSGGQAESPSGTREEASGAVESGAADQQVAEREQLSDREIIIDILEDNDGRMKQARIVDTTGWSKSKVSMLLSEMEDDDEVTKLRVGRENIVSLSGREPDAAGSPFDGE